MNSRLSRTLAVLLAATAGVCTAHACYRLIAGGLGSGTEMTPCVGICNAYMVCPDGDVCTGGFITGWTDCSCGNVLRPVEVWSGGVTNAAGCCTGGAFLMMHATATCTSPSCTLSATTCWGFIFHD